MFCNQCGHKNPENAKFCSACGAQLEGVEKQEEEASPFDLPPLDAAAEQPAKPEEPESSPVQLGQVDEQMLEDHITAKEFAELTRQTEASVIQRIKVGDYRGRVKNDVWYIHLKENQLPQASSKSKSEHKPQERTTPASSYAAELGYDESEVIQKIRDGELNGRLENGEWVIVLGHYNPKSSVEQARAEQSTQDTQSKADNQFWLDKLMKGDYGLAKTYWLFGFLVFFTVNFLSNFITSTKLLGTVTIVMLIYNIMWIIAVFKAARKYEGPVFWAYLARIMVLLPWIGIILAIVIPAMNS